ncbi:MAG: TIGR00282 family metallophosphoesterase [Sphaerochaetaceae bacterium]|jgi:metallophosphoesterase (TIGR00282 family)
MSIRILFLGEIVGKPGIQALKNGLKGLKERESIDFVVANGEGATGGFGIGKNHALQITKLGVDLITTGEKTYYKKDMVEYIGQNRKIIRPANYPFGNPGRGFGIFHIGEIRVAFINLLGNADFNRTHTSNPFIQANSLVEKLLPESDAICLQFHASTTAEKQTMAHHLKGRVAAVIGTHSKVLSSDARILEEATAAITDNGRCGSALSVGGFDSSVEIERFLTQIPSRSVESYKNLELQGVIVEITKDGKATSITTVKESVDMDQ